MANAAGIMALRPDPRGRRCHLAQAVQDQRDALMRLTRAVVPLMLEVTWVPSDAGL